MPERRPSPAGRRGWRRGRRGGFTLVELVMVVMIVAIFAAIVAPRYTSGLTRYRCDAAARRLAADLELARSTARTRSTSVAIQFDAAASTYDIPAIAHLDRPGDAYRVDLREAPYEATIQSLTLEDSAAAITFDAFGEPDRTGSIVLAAGDVRRTVDIAGDGGVTW